MEISIEPMSPDQREAVLAIYAEGIATGLATFETEAPEWDRTHLEKCRFVARGDSFELDPRVRSLVAVARHDLGRDPWPQQLDAIFMRNVVFTYWGLERQRWAVEQILAALRPHGWLVIGTHEELPAGSDAWFDRQGRVPVYRRRE